MSGNGLPFAKNRVIEFRVKFGTYDLTMYTQNKYVYIDVNATT